MTFALIIPHYSNFMSVYLHKLDLLETIIIVLNHNILLHINTLIQQVCYLSKEKKIICVNILRILSNNGDFKNDFFSILIDIIICSQYLWIIHGHHFKLKVINAYF